MSYRNIKAIVDNENEPINKKFKLSEKEKKNSTDNENEERVMYKIKENDEVDDAMFGEQDIPLKGFDYPLEQDASDMLDEVDEFVDGRFPSVTERYFTPYYQLDVQKPGDDICIRIHSNRICMISLAPSHIIFQDNKKIQSCNFKISDKLDRTKNKTSGKAKHGAQPLQSNSNLCCLTCNDGTSYMIKCCMIGKLIEVNERLIDNPELLKMEPHFGGYIAIVLPNLKHLENMRQNLLTQDRYEESIKKRKQTINQKGNEVNIETIENKNSEKKEEKNETVITEINETYITIDTNIEKESPDKEVTAMEIV